ncbi:MAG: putative lipid II flippase FtsW [Bdellovibrionales bacterium]|nr:putative lipid II flippase FtsW [Bdellovibrionales bacterium]
MSLKTSILRKLTNVDSVLLLSVLGLTALGVIMIYSASSPLAGDKYGDHMFFLKKHMFWLCVAFVALIVGFSLKPQFLKIVALPTLAAVTILLILTKVFGDTANYARRWITLGPLTMQPSEFAKPVILIYAAAYLSKKGEKLKQFSIGMLPLLCTTGAVLSLILAQPDFGTTVTLGTIIMLMMFVAGVPLRQLFCVVILAGSGISYLMMEASYRKKRILAFLDPWNDPKGSGFQIIQSFIAFKRGGFQGQGLGDGTQKLLYLPEAHTDFIYSVIAEELGVLGSLLVIFLFSCIVVQGMRLSLRIKDSFASLVAFGLTSMIGIQALLNMAVTMALVPTKGLTLPFVSYGGSSLVSLFGVIGILLSLSSSVNVSGRMARRTIQ